MSIVFYATPGDWEVCLAMTRWVKKRINTELSVITFRNYPEKTKLKKSDFVNFERIISESQIIDKNISVEKEYIKHIQENILNGYPFWKVVQHDRFLMYERDGSIYDKGFSGGDSERLKRVGKRFKYIENFLLSRKASLLIYSGIDTGSNSALISYLVSKSNNIKTIVPHYSRVGSYYGFSKSVFSKGVLNNYNLDDKRSGKIKKGKLSYMDNENRTTLKSKIKRELEKFKVRDYYKKRAFYLLYDKIRKKIFEIRKKSTFEKYNIESIDRPFIYFPLHVEPELALSLYAPDFKSQSYVAQIISQNLEYPYSLVVKEHPNTVYREKGFYESLKNIPNTTLVSPDLSSEELIEESEATITISGTAALEAALQSKHSAVFGEVYFEKHFDSIRQISSINDLNVFLSRVYSTDVKNKKDIEKFYDLILQNCVGFDVFKAANQLSAPEIYEMTEFEAYMNKMTKRFDILGR